MFWWQVLSADEVEIAMGEVAFANTLNLFL